MCDTVYIYQTNTDFVGVNGQLYSGRRWVSNLDGKRFTTKKTRKEAVRHAQNNLGVDVAIIFGAPA